MDVHVEHPYDASPDDVFAMLTDPEFLRARLEATGALKYEVVECEETSDGGFRIVTRRTVQADIPGFARRVFTPTNSMTQVEDWRPAFEGAREGMWRIDAQGVPVSTSGTTHLESVDGGAAQYIDGTIKVSVPLIGGRLERFVFDQAMKTLDVEHVFGRKWLTERT